jgi:LacI family transcriptional regulator
VARSKSETKAQGSPRATIRDVARQSGFSSSTVSIVLNDAPLARYIPKVTKDRIEATAKKLGYRPNLFARSLRSNRTHTMGVLVFDMGDPFCTPIIQGIEDALYQKSYLPILTDVQNERSRFETYLEMLLGLRVEGLIVLGNWLFMDVDVLADLAKNSIPTVMIGHELKKGPVSSVTVDNEAGARLAIEHLFALGHREIAFIRGPKGLGDSAPRWRGVKKFAEAQGLVLDPDRIIDLPESQHPNSGFEAGLAITKRLVDHGQRFTALMAFDDMSALGAIRALNTAGIDVPGQCSVIGFDDVSHAALITPALTTIRQPMDLMGSMSVDIALEAIKAEEDSKQFTAVHRRLAPKLMARDSTRSLAGFAADRPLDRDADAISTMHLAFGDN